MGGLAYIPVLKADAYGHGALTIARILEGATNERECPYFAVARLAEATELRASGVARPLLVLSEFSETAGMWPSGVDLVVSSAADVEFLKAQRPRIGGVHFDINTGMNRLGLHLAPGLATRVAGWARELAALGISTRGLMTHLARAEDAPEILSRRQFADFTQFVSALRAQWPAEAGKFPAWIHGANSPGAAQGLGAADAGVFTAFRPGIHLWGCRDVPSTPVRVELKPVARVGAPIRQFHLCAAGEGVGYGHRFVCTRPSLLGTVALGYADGVDRRLSRRADEAWKLGFVIDGIRVPVAGTVSMDLTTVDLTDHPARAQWETQVGRGETPAVFAEWIAPGQSAEEIAGHLGTISYEILCRLGRRLPRRLLADEGRVA